MQLNVLDDLAEAMKALDGKKTEGFDLCLNRALTCLLSEFQLT